MRVFGLEIKRAGRGNEGRQVQGNGTGWLSNLLTGWLSESSGQAPVTEENSLKISAVYTAVRIIGGTMSSLPLFTMRRTEQGRTYALRHWAYPLLHDSPNEYHTASTWVELLVAHRLLWGNAYNRIEWLGNGSAGALYPLMIWRIARRAPGNGRGFAFSGPRI